MSQQQTPPALLEFQRSLQRLFTDSGVRANGTDDPALLGAFALLEETPGFSAAERADVYFASFFARIVDYLAGEFPRLRRYVGLVPFDRLANVCAESRPSRYRSLADYGREFVDHVTEQVDDPLAHELVRFEWALVESFFADIPASVEPTENVRIALHPSARLLDSRFALDEMIEKPAESLGSDSAPAPGEPAYYVVHRPEHKVRVSRVSPLEHELLESMRQPQSIEALAEILEQRAPEEIGTTSLSERFARWLRMGIITLITPPVPPN